MKNYNKILEAINNGIQLALDDFDDNDTPIQNIKSRQESVSFEKLIAQNIQNNRPLSKEMWQGVFKNLPLYLKELGMTDEQFYIIRYMVSRYNPDKLDKDLREIYEKNKPLFSTKFRKISSKRELQEIIVETIKEEGPNCDLNWIDVSGITDMSYLFDFTEYFDYSTARQFKKQYPFNCDISKWDVSNVKTMEGLFCGENEFNQDISNWDVSNVENMSSMFIGANKFNQPIGKWNVSNVKAFENMFNWAESFNQNISNWKIRPDADIFNRSEVDSIKMMFNKCPIKPEFLPKQLQKMILKTI